MNKSLLQRVEQVNNQRRSGIKPARFLSCVLSCCLVFFIVSPVLAQERQTICGQLAHEHFDGCFVQKSVAKRLVHICSYGELGVHVHDSPCRDDKGRVLCGQADYVIHTHGDICYDLEGYLACLLPEMSQHVHSDQCYDLENRHIHEGSCYTAQPGELICELPEEEGHFHGESCYGPGENLLCPLEEGHVHEEVCFSEESLVCERPENHLHEPSCYEQVLQCVLPEVEGHTHGESCYEQLQVLSCPLEEYVGDPVLVCTEPDAVIHDHSRYCYDMEAVEQPLTCRLEENSQHTHGTYCYGDWKRICVFEEHTHTQDCYADKTADVETQSMWEETFAHVELTGDWARDVLMIAVTQLGYCESDWNYIILEDGVTIHGYSRYGDWYGDHYGDWCAMFVSFCLYYAGVDTMPLEAYCPTWVKLLSDPEVDLFRPAGSYTPKSGDLIFFDYERDGISDHVGFVVEILEATDETPAQYITLEGNSGDRVRYASYDLDDRRIQGFGILPENPHNRAPDAQVPVVTDDVKTDPEITQISHETNADVLPETGIIEEMPEEPEESTPWSAVTIVALVLFLFLLAGLLVSDHPIADWKDKRPWVWERNVKPRK